MHRMLVGTVATSPTCSPVGGDVAGGWRVSARGRGTEISPMC